MPDQIKNILDEINPNIIIEAIKEGFINYSKKKFHASEVVHLGKAECSKSEIPQLKGKGQVCVKSGYSIQGDYYIVKVAAGGFLDSSNSGVMLLFSQITGQLLAILADNGILTDHRTAAAGVLSVKEMGPGNIECVGIVGTGFQARFHFRYLMSVIKCRKAVIWGRNTYKLKSLKEEINSLGWILEITKDISVLTKNCNVIITTTSATEAIINASLVQPGTHISCIGADGLGKQEIDPFLFSRTECRLVVADSIGQCIKFGELQHAVSRGLIDPLKIIEFGNFCSRTNGVYKREKSEISVFDSTGVSVQDYAIAKIVYEAFNNKYVEAKM